MVTVETQSAIRSLTAGIDQQSGWLDPLAKQLQQAISAGIQAGGEPAQRAKDFLNGIWLGHPLHPALTDVPVGAWWIAAFLDVAGARRGADLATLTGVLAAIPTAASGLADWHDAADQPRRVGLIHALLNTAALGCYTGSLSARQGGNRGVGMVLSGLGLALVTASAYLGGDLAYRYGLGVDHNAWAPSAEEFQPAAKSADVPEGQLTAGEITVEGQKEPLVLLRRDGQVYALGAVCAHMGGPLAEGTLVDDCVQCPWHGSRFDMRDGTVQRGPSAFSQPTYETRERNGNVEVRRIH